MPVNEAVAFAPALSRIMRGEDLLPEEMTAFMREMVAGRLEDAQGAALLTALRMKGESATEIAAGALVLREQMICLSPSVGPVLDTCGTGGDGLGTFNISTAAAIVASAAGVPVVKHGNRAVSSTSGSADVLRELGVPIENGAAWAQHTLDRHGFAFCYAPHFHPGVANVGKIRKALGIRTLFNLLGPLANPAGAEFQLLGVGSLELMNSLTGAVALLGMRRAILVCGHDGLDEVTLAAPTMVRIVEGKNYRLEEWTPQDFGLKVQSTSAVKASSATESAQIIRKVFIGEAGPALDYVLANAATALFTIGKVNTLKDGVDLARNTITTGQAERLLNTLATPSSAGLPHYAT